VNFFVGAFYDGVYLLGMAMNETLSEGGTIHNGTAITRRMWNRDFHGELNILHVMKLTVM
jgi:atrial natriuretic peptide receptor A